MNGNPGPVVMVAVVALSAWYVLMVYADAISRIFPFWYLTGVYLFSVYAVIEATLAALGMRMIYRKVRSRLKRW